MIPYGNSLFTRYRLSTTLLQNKAILEKEIYDMKPEIIKESNIDDLYDRLNKKYEINMIVIEDGKMEMTSSETNVDISQDPNYGIFDRSRPVYKKGTCVNFHFPFSGDTNLFENSPNHTDLNPPKAIVENSELIISFIGITLNAEELKRSCTQQLNKIREYLRHVNEQVKVYNSEIKQTILSILKERIDKISKDAELLKELGFPLKKRKDSVDAFSIPVIKKKIAPVTKPAAAKLGLPEPYLKNEDYEVILNSIKNMALVFERSPQAFEHMDEPDLRWLFLIPLNNQFEGQVSGETFNFSGKTDILIRSNNKNIFIAELKIWDGEKKLLDTIDQLLGYVSWRDTKTAIIIFNRKKNFSNVLKKIHEISMSHPNFESIIDKKESEFRFIFHHRDDVNRKLYLTIMAFEVPI